ncbi:MAG TPA: tripartite tricarboxylate transporter substrate-binding protein, partial [Burkholderiales bacterium]|nr:tripartite tricarboxylate transporter substrate-binding protein [Burkholderiales bacterium]
MPFPPGGGTDIVARAVAARLTEGWGQQIIIDNRGGAGGVIGADTVA